jgi:peptidoglycan/xylan/chitin deacetylase (PgdA/CDA1 family)
VGSASRPLVLCYHAVSDAWDHALAVGATSIERQLSGLVRRGYQPVRADDAVHGRGGLLHVTFDDAFRTVGNAMPMLERLGVPATVFACSDYAEAAGRWTCRSSSARLESRLKSSRR